MQCETAERMTKRALNAITREIRVRRYPSRKPIVTSAQQSTERARKALREHISSCGECHRPADIFSKRITAQPRPSRVGRSSWAA